MAQPWYFPWRPGPKMLMGSCDTFGATRMALLRSDSNGRSQLERAPSEIKLMIIGEIIEPKEILNLALTGPTFCAFIAVHETTISEAVIKYHLEPEVMRLAVATRAAQEASWNVRQSNVNLNSTEPLSASYVNSIVQFVEKYRQPGEFTLRAQHPNGLSLSEAFLYITDYRSISTTAVLLSNYTSLQAGKRNPGFNLELSPMVFTRYKRAIYITQLASELFSFRGGGQPARMHLAWGMFWFALTPWEVEQVYGVQFHFTSYIFCELTRVLSYDRIAHYNGSSTLAKFVAFYGPQRLRSMYLKARDLQALAEVFDTFRMLNPSGFIHTLYCAPAFGLGTRLDKIGKRFNQSREDGSPAYGDLDIGPMKHWYSLFLFRALGNIRRPRSAHSFFSCRDCLIQSGYAFWDDLNLGRLRSFTVNDLHRRAAFVRRRSQPGRFDSPQMYPTSLTWFRGWETCPHVSDPPPSQLERLTVGLELSNEYSLYGTGQLLAEGIERAR